MLIVVKLEEGEHQRAREGQGHRAEQDHQRVPEVAELRGEHQVDEDDGEEQRAGQGGALGAQLPGLAGIVDGVAGGQDARGGGLERGEALLLGEAGVHAAVHAERVPLLEAVEGARRGAALDAGEAGDRDQVAVGAHHLEIQQSARVAPLGVAHLGYHLVAAAIQVEAVHVATGQQHPQLLAHLGEVEPQVSDPVPVDHHVGLGDVDLEVRVGKHEHVG